MRCYHCGGERGTADIDGYCARCRYQPTFATTLLERLEPPPVADPQAELAEAVALLRQSVSLNNYCPLCGLPIHYEPHHPDCRLAAFLARHGEATPPNPDPVCADCGRDLPADGYCECAKQEATPS